MKGDSSKGRRTNRKALKQELLEVLRSDDPDCGLGVLKNKPSKAVVNILFSFLLNHEPLIRWRAVTAMGYVVAQLAEADIESARVVIRRMIWQLNDESGGIGWGCPEAMGEVVARDRRLRAEYTHMLISYVREDANFLEYEPLRAGAVWAIGRLAQESPELVRETIPHLLPALEAAEPSLRAMAVWTLGQLRAEEAVSTLITLQADRAEVEIYEDQRVRHLLIKDLAEEALMRIRERF